MACGVNVEQPGLLKEFFLDDCAVKAALLQLLADGLHGCACAVVDLDHDLLDQRPMRFLDAAEDSQLALLGINFQEVDPLDPVFSNDV